MEKKERFCEYHIAVIGDDFLSGNIVLSDSEAEVVKKVLNCLTPNGKYVPTINFVNMDEARKMKEEHKKKVAEEKKKKLDHAMGLDVQFKSEMQIAFEKAMKKS